MKSKVLLIYTGGTIGMMQDAKSGQLKPFDFKHLRDQIPELNKFDIALSAISFDRPIDSSDMEPSIWIKLAKIIEKNYSAADGFVILHGSDTMSFTASALSFMLENLNKPIILTGSQLPIGMVRTDGKENLITAIEIAAAKKNGKPVVPEVCIYFEYQLYRGNRTHKYNSEHFQAFQSANYPVLAEAGVHLKYNHGAIKKGNAKKLKVQTLLNPNIAILKLFPGITPQAAEAILHTKNCKAVILETFGSGNAGTQKWFIHALKTAIEKGMIILNVTQCNAGGVMQGKYAASAALSKIGVISGADITADAATAKLMYVLGATSDKKKIEKLLKTNLRGEITV
ncbi:MAG: L-asparaginase 1 [Candidatus Nephrothrix sp. EaCA]|nr:MAG: L-asparaginase 1 [Candidatus Nephrothrix sp. EaCA]